ncbi:MAG TPA: type II toxin-antitoxin system Phd/YefM family antitoxin [Acetobacteraceae bacterium]|nr:type II toxin-antitoxin system Phd/YefM family antitoxin [Acetobacteraceae bacterium]
MPGADAETAINVTAFKAQCLALIDAVAAGKASRVVLTRRGRPVAALVPYGQRLPELWGALRGTAKITSGSDLARSTDEVWKADA